MRGWTLGVRLCERRPEADANEGGDANEEGDGWKRWEGGEGGGWRLLYDSLMHASCNSRGCVNASHGRRQPQTDSVRKLSREYPRLIRQTKELV